MAEPGRAETVECVCHVAGCVGGLYGRDDAHFGHEALVGGVDDLAVFEAEATGVFLGLCDAGAEGGGLVRRRGDVVGWWAGGTEGCVEGGERGACGAVADGVDVDLVVCGVPLGLCWRGEGSRGLEPVDIPL